MNVSAAITEARPFSRYWGRSQDEPASMEKICQIDVDIPNAPDLVLDLLAAHGAALSGKTICEAGRLLV
jgi:hypothetical protein